VSQIKEQLEAIGDMVEDVEVVMTTLNGLLGDWEPFVRGICARKKLIQFRQLWEECVQEEERIAVREEKINDNEDQALASCQRWKEKEDKYTFLRGLSKKTLEEKEVQERPIFS
jgi:hypothetical protein